MEKIYKSVLAIAALLVLLAIYGYTTREGQYLNETVELEPLMCSDNVENLAFADTMSSFDMIYHVGNKTYAGIAFNRVNDGRYLPINWEYEKSNVLDGWISQSNGDGYLVGDLFKDGYRYRIKAIMDGNTVYYNTETQYLGKLFYVSEYKVDGNNRVLIKRHADLKGYLRQENNISQSHTWG